MTNLAVDRVSLTDKETDQKKLRFVYLDGKARVHVFARLSTVHPLEKPRFAGALRGERDVVVDVLAPFHKQVRVGIISPFPGAPHYVLADFSYLLTKSDFIAGTRNLFTDWS